MLQGRSALVTGSTSGIGLGVARALAHQGANLMLNGFGDVDAIEELRSKLEHQAGTRVGFNGANLAEPEEVAELIDRTQVELGGLDILVNNAGIQHVAPIDEFALERWNAIIAVNLSSVFLTMKFAIPAMRERGWGRIINVASAHGLVGSPNKVAYVAAKHGVVGATKAVALELANTGITVNAICPGWVRTPLVEQQLEDRARQNGTDVEHESDLLLREKQPMLSFTSVEAIGAMAVFLCTDDASTMTGAPLSIDGGWVAQ